MDNIDIQMDAIESDRNVGQVLPAFGCLIFPFSMLRRVYESYAASDMASFRVFSFFFHYIDDSFFGIGAIRVSET